MSGPAPMKRGNTMLNCDFFELCLMAGVGKRTEKRVVLEVVSV